MKLFKERLPLLTNMANIPMNVNGKVFSCVEAAFQSFKAVIANCPNMVDDFTGIDGYTAKRKGRTVPLKPYLNIWNEVRVDIMWQLLLIKVQNAAVKKMLISATDEELIENNTWGDTFWGCVEQPDGTMVGQNMLGKLWQEVRKVCLRQPDTKVFQDLPCPF